jgi:hypothetical protein
MVMGSKFTFFFAASFEEDAANFCVLPQGAPLGASAEKERLGENDNALSHQVQVSLKPITQPEDLRQTGA